MAAAAILVLALILVGVAGAGQAASGELKAADFPTAVRLLRQPTTTSRQSTSGPPTAAAPAPLEATHPTPEGTLSTTRQAQSTPTPGRTQFVYGHSIEGRLLVVERYGAPSSKAPAGLVIVGALHGNEANTAHFVQDLTAAANQGLMDVPESVSLYLIANANPDGLAHARRNNATGVDLNRNWQTFDWQQDTWSSSGFLPGAGGDAAFSEPETRALRDWILATRAEHASSLQVIFVHAAFPIAGLILPGHHWVAGQVLADRSARQLGQQLAGATGFQYANQWPGSYPVTGDATTWAVAHGIPAITVELPTHEMMSAPDMAIMIHGIELLLQTISEQTTTD
ncbi:MAG: M14 family metallopeptidase [Anaerolineales bacterium]